MPSLSIAKAKALEELLDAHLLERLTALEARVGQGSVQAAQPLGAVNASRAAAAERVRTAITELLAAHSGPRPLGAKAVLAALEGRGVEPLPALRTVQRQLATLSSGSATRHT
jgi:hypothetical protein